MYMLTLVRIHIVIVLAYPKIYSRKGLKPLESREEYQTPKKIVIQVHGDYGVLGESEVSRAAWGEGLREG